MVSPEHKGRGLSAEILRSLAREYVLDYLVAPVRPTHPQERLPARALREVRGVGAGRRLALRRMAQGPPQERGAAFLRVIAASPVVTGSVSEWEEWTNMAFPESGRYVVPGALQPVTIDRERDAGRYDDPNVWMRHPLS